VTDAIYAAQSSIDIAMYNLNLREVEQALRDAHKRGVNVRLVVESDALDGWVPQSLKSSGIPVVSDGRESLMHNKFMVIDKHQVWTGSLNLTENGVIEDRNNLVRVDSPSIAEYYTQEFEEMFTAGEFGNNSPQGNPEEGRFKAGDIPPPMMGSWTSCWKRWPAPGRRSFFSVILLHPIRWRRRW